MSSSSSREDNLSNILFRTSLSRYSEITDPEEIELAHEEALHAAHAEHERVREQALRAYRNWKLAEDKSRLQEIEKHEAEQLILEKERKEVEARVAELQRQREELARAPPPPILPPSLPQPPRSSPASTVVESVPPRPQSAALPSPQHSTRETSELAKPAPSKTQEFKLPDNQAPQVNPSTIISASKQKELPPQQTLQVVQPARQKPPPPATAPVTRVPQHPANTHILPGTHGYLEIHKRLKQLRVFMTENAKQHPELKKRMGESRREIRKSVGQLTEGRGANRAPVSIIFSGPHLFYS
jgi:nucleoporin GLE1